MQESILTECDMSHSKYHKVLLNHSSNFSEKNCKKQPWLQASICTPFHHIPLKHVSLIAILVEQICSKNSNIVKYQETNISCAHILELYIFPWRYKLWLQIVRGGLKYMYLGWLKHGGTGTILHVNYRQWSKFMHRNVRHKVHKYTAVTCQSSTCFHLKYSY